MDTWRSSQSGCFSPLLIGLVFGDAGLSRSSASTRCEVSLPHVFVVILLFLRDLIRYIPIHSRGSLTKCRVLLDMYSYVF
jgi:hypothetical protein